MARPLGKKNISQDIRKAIVIGFRSGCSKDLLAQQFNVTKRAIEKILKQFRDEVIFKNSIVMKKKGLGSLGGAKIAWKTAYHVEEHGSEHRPSFKRGSPEEFYEHSDGREDTK